MNYYPFDVQNCNASFAPKANSDVFVQLITTTEPIYQGSSELMQYKFEGIKYLNTSEDTVHVQLTMGRVILSEALTTILPSVLIVMVN